MTMRKMLAVLATLAMLCTVLPLGAIFSATADANVIENSTFDDGTQGWASSSKVSVVDGVLVFECTQDWANVYKYANGMKANTDYVYTFRAKANMNSNMNIKINDNWAKDSAHVKFDVTTEWQEFTVDVNSGDFKSSPILMFSVNVPASTGMIFYLDYVTITEKADAPVTPDEPADDNLIVNGDFETGDASGWETWQSTVIEAAAAKDGAFGAHLVGNGGWGGMLNQTVKVEAGKQYKLSFWINVNAMGVNLQVKDGAGKAIEGAGGWFDANKKDKVVEYTFIAPDNSVLINFCGSGSAPEDVYVDNFSLVCLDNGDAPAEPSNDGYIINGDFETGDIAPWDNLWGSCPTAEVIEGGKDSAYALNVVSKQWCHVRQTNIAVEANTDYKISAWAKNANNMCLLVKNGGDSKDLANVGVNAGDEWTLFTVEFNSGEFTSIIFSLMGGEGADQYGIFDNIVMEKVGGSEPDQPDVPVEPDEPDEPVTPPADGDILNATFDTDEFDGILSSSDISVADGELQFVVNKDWGNVYTGFEVEANTDYEVTFRAKSKLGKTVWAKFHKADWTGDICQQTAALSTSWKDYTYTMNSGDNTYVYLLIQYAGYAAEGETIWFDYITVKKIGGGSEPEAPSDNLIVNGDFETGDASGWETWQSTVINADAAKDGNFGANLIGNGGWGGMLNQTMKVEAGKEYKLSFWIYVVKTGVNVQVKDGAGKGIEGAGAWLDASNQGKVIEWTFVAPDDTVLINFCGSGAAPEEAYVDNFVLKAVEAPAPSGGLVTNGDFETGDATGWETWQSTVVNEEAAKNGKYGVNLLGNGGWGGLLNQTFKVEKGETYVITLWACVNSSGANLQIKGADKVEGECDNTYLDAKELSGWTQRTFTVVANSDEITLNFCGGGTGKSEDLYIDDIVVTKKGEAPVVDETSPIKNAGFETGDLGAWKNLWDSCIYSFDTPGYNGSNFALNYAAEGQWRQIRQDMIPVEKNTDYVVVGYVKNPMNVNIVVKTGDDSANINEIAIENDMSNKWVRAAVEFNSGDLDAICVLLISREAVASAIWDDVQVYVKGTEPTDVVNDDEVTEGPIQLDFYGVSINRPATPEANLILNGSFEDAEGGQWQSIISDTLYVVDDETAPEGNKSLFFNTSGVTENNKTIFYLDVEPNTDYVFSAWVKGAFISDTNRFNATFGVTDWKDNFCVYNDAVFSNKTRQIVPTAWDNEWHLRAVQFNSGANIKVGIGFAGAESQMWIDGIALYTVENGIKYGDPRQIYDIVGSALEDGEEGTCADENNLIVDGAMNGAEAKEFWSTADGFKNGFLTFVENEYEYGNVMQYAGDEDSCYTYAIKWLEVTPNTDYIFSVDLRVVQSGGGGFSLLDGKKRECEEFLVFYFDQYDHGTEWNHLAVQFNSGEFDRIGIAVMDGGGVALIDNMRLYEAANRIDGGDDNYVKPPYTLGGEDDPFLPEGGTGVNPEDPDSPATGVSMMGAALAVALVPASAAVALKLRRKKEDEE